MKTNDDYWKLAESERHFNETQAGIRNHAATWMLAAFAAIAIRLKSEDKVNWLVSPAVLVVVVSVMTSGTRISPPCSTARTMPAPFRQGYREAETG